MFQHSIKALLREARQIDLASKENPGQPFSQKRYDQSHSASEAKPKLTQSPQHQRPLPFQQVFLEFARHEPRQESAVNDLAQVQNPFDDDGLPQTLRNVNLLRQSPTKIDSLAGIRAKLLHIRDYEDAGTPVQDVKPPPQPFDTPYYSKATLEKRHMHFLRTKEQDSGMWPLAPLQVSLKFSSLVEDAGQELKQGMRAFSNLNLLHSVNDYKCMIMESGQYGSRTDLITSASLGFHNDIVRRVNYISEFSAWDGNCYKPTITNGAGRVAGIELDVWLFQKGIVRQWEVRSDKSNKKEYKHECDILWQMYGLGRNDLEFLCNNPQAGDRAEQIDTLQRFHILQAMISREEVEDIRKQLCFCSYAIREARKAHKDPNLRRQGGRGSNNKSNGSSAGYQDPKRPRFPARTPAEYRREQCAEARKREFIIAKLLVDKVCEDVERHPPGRRTLPKRCRGDRDDWENLNRTEQVRLLWGNPEHVRRFIR